MIALSGKSLCALREAVREIGEDSVTVSTPAGVITFKFRGPDIHARRLSYESQPSRQELAALLGIPVTAETA